MKLIEDLGQLYPTKSSKYKSRYAIFECNNCNINFKANAKDAKMRKQEYCNNCKYTNHIKHNDHKSRLYKIWAGLKTRCNNIKDTNYLNYGGRGISYSNLWEEYIVFKEWAILNGYNDSLTIERINVDLNYEPDNCTWISFHEQQFNKRTSINISIDDAFNIKELYKNTKTSHRKLGKEYNVSYATIRSIINNNYTEYNNKIYTKGKK